MSGVAHIERTDRIQLGMFMMLSAWFFFSLVDTSVKWLVLAGLPALQLAFARYAGQFFITCLLSLKNIGPLPRLTQQQVLLLTIRSALLASATVFNFYALRFLPLSLTASIMFSSPIFVSLLAVPLLGERIGRWRWGAILFGFLGVLVIVQPFGGSFHPAALIIVYNALALALFSILTRKLSGQVSAQTMQVFMGGLGTLVLLPLSLFVWELPGSGLNWALMLGLGVWAWAGHEIFTRAHAHAPASTLMPFSYSFILYLSVASYLVWAELPAFSTLIGATIIVISGLIIWWRENLIPERSTS